MVYANKYRIAILNPGVANIEGSETPFSIIIQERDYSGAETVLKGTTSAGTLQYLDTNERKYPAIQASQFDITFWSENNFSLEDIITEDNFQYRVVIAYGAYNGAVFEDRPVWYGFLVTDDCTEQAQDDPKEIRLRATDGLGLLKSQPLFGIEVYEKRALLELIDRCISFTGLKLDLLIECSVFEESMTDRSVVQESEPFSQCKVHTRSFLSDSNTYTNCYEVLESILSAFKCSIFQQNGRWHIQRKHDRWNQEMELGTVLVYPYYTNEPEASLLNYKVAIDQVERYTINADMIKGYIGASGFSKIRYSYKTPIIPRNGNFQQGNFYAPVSGTTNTAYTIFYWQYFIAAGSIMGSPSEMTPYRNVVFDPETGNPIESYIVLPDRHPGNTAQFLLSEGAEVSRGDKLTFSADLRTAFNIPGVISVNLVQILIIEPNGTIWYFHKLIGYDGYNDDVPKWTNSAADGNVIMRLNGGEAGNTDNWYSGSFTTEPFPVDGTMYFRLYTVTDNSKPNSTWYRNISFDWHFFVNSVTKVIGEEDKLSKSGVYRNKTEEEITIGDAPKKTINGALFRATDDTQLTANWHRQGKNESERLIRINDICLHQSTHRLYTKLDGTFLGITYALLDAKQIIGPANLFYFPKSPLKDKFYLPTNLTISLGTNTFTATLQEFYDTTKDNGDPQSDSKAFQYIYE